MLFALVVVFFRPPFDLDFCWQIRTGERILATGELRQPEAFSYTIAGKIIPDHEWLYEAGLAVAWRSAGDAGLKLARVVMFFAPIAILAWQLRQRGVPDYATALAMIACVLIFFFFERLRPLVCSTIGLQLVSGWLHDHCHGRRRLDWKLPVCMLLWGNLHPAVIMGQALILGAIAWEWLSYFRWRCTELGRVKSLTCWGLVGVAATLIAPAPLDRLLYPFAPELRDSAQLLFVEIKPPWHFLTSSYAVWLAMIMAIVYGVVLALRWRQLRGWEWALVAGVTALALMAVRGVGDWLMITTALAVPQIGPLLLDATKSRRWHKLARPFVRLDRTLRRVFSGAMLRVQPGWLLIGFGLMVAVALLPWGERLPNRENADWPREAVDWVAAEQLPTPSPWKVFSGGNEGAYMIWRLDGRARVYADTRGFYYPGELLADSYHLSSASPGWQARLSRALDKGSEYFLLPIKSGLWETLQPHIKQPLHRDSKYVILSAAQVRDAAQMIEADSQHLATNRRAE